MPFSSVAVSTIAGSFAQTHVPSRRTIADNDATKPASFVYLKVDKDMKKIFVNDIDYIESWKDM